MGGFCHGRTLTYTDKVLVQPAAEEKVKDSQFLSFVCVGLWISTSEMGGVKPFKIALTNVRSCRACPFHDYHSYNGGFMRR